MFFFSLKSVSGTKTVHGLGSRGVFVATKCNAEQKNHRPGLAPILACGGWTTSRSCGEDMTRSLSYFWTDVRGYPLDFYVWLIGFLFIKFDLEENWRVKVTDCNSPSCFLVKSSCED